MEIEEAIRTYLLTKTALTALVSTRIFPDDYSDGFTLPAVVYQKISDVKEHAHDGQLKQESPNIQYTIYAGSKASARQISALVKSALCDYVGTLSGVVVNYITLLNEMSGAEMSGDGTQKIYTEDLEFQIDYTRE